MHNVDTIMPGAIASLVLDAARDAVGARDARSLSVLDVIRQPYSLVAKVRVNTDGVPAILFVKMVESARADAAQKIRAEFNVLKHLHTVDFRGSAQIVVPVSHIDDPPVIVTMGMSGEPFAQVLRTTFRSRILRGAANPVRDACRRAGEWLRILHGVRPDAAGVDSTISHRDYCQSRLDRLMRDSPPFSRSEADAIAAFIARAGGEIGNEELCICHGDFAPHNILFDNGSIGVLDFTAACRSIPEDDLTAFIRPLDDLMNQPLVPRNKAQALIDSFLDGYGYEKPLWGERMQLGAMRWWLSSMVTLRAARTRRPDVWLDNRRRFARYRSYLRGLARRESGLQPGQGTQAPAPGADA